jgi:sec-independent protein translocase protein TatC
MGFFDHIDELRVRLMRCLWVFMAGFSLCYLIAPQIMDFLRAPLFEVLPPDKRQLYFTSLFENFLTHLKIAGYASLVFLSPYYFYELWRFVSPGLYPRERKWVMPFVIAGCFFFVLGAGFAYSVLFPVGFKYFITYGGPDEVPLLTIESFYSTAIKLLFLFGVAFELPVIIAFLGLMGVVDAEQLRTQRKPAILAITIVSAFVAPPDAISMLILMAPLILMYEGSIWVVQWFGKKKKGAEPAKAVEDPWVGRSQ